MNERLNNKQKFWLSFTAILMIGIFFNSLVIGLAWVNSPTIWSTYHNFDLQSDEYSARMLESMATISNSQNQDQDQQCIVKEYDYYETIDPYWNKTIQGKYLVNEYLTENCTIIIS